MIVDSGATTSIGERRFFIESTLRPCNTKIQCANGKYMTCSLRGTMVVEIGGKQVFIENALCIDGVVNLLSVNQLVNKGYILVFDNESVGVFASKNDVLSEKPFMLLERRLGDKLWTFDQPVKAVLEHQKPLAKQSKQEKLAYAMLTKILTEEDLVTLHNKFAHCSLPVLKILFPTHLEKVTKLPPCHACLSMQFKKKYKKTTDYADEDSGEIISMTQDPEAQREVFAKYLAREEVKETKEGQKITVKDFKIKDLSPEEDLQKGVKDKDSPFDGDVLDSQTILHDDEKAFFGNPKDVPKGYGRMMMTDTKVVTKPSVRNYRYFHIILDRDTRLCESCLSETKDEMERHLKEFMRKFYNQHRRFPAFWKFDLGGENYSHSIINFLNSCGTQVIYAGTNDHNSNAHAERKICIIWDSVMKTLAHTNVPFNYWCYCVEYITIILNHLPSRALNGQVPQQAAKKISLLYQLLIWGSGVWYSLPDNKDFQTRRRFGVLLGLSKIKMTYCVLDLETREVIDSRNVVSIPNNFPFRDAYKIPASVIRLDYDNWPGLMPQEKISMEVENMLLKLAPKEGGNTLENLIKVPISGQEDKHDANLPDKVSSVSKVPASDNVDISNILSPISNSNSTMVTPMTSFSQRSQGVDTKHNDTDGMSETLDLGKKPPKIPTELVEAKDANILETKVDLFPESPKIEVDAQKIDDPLNLSNLQPEQEEKLKKLKVHKFKVNGQKAEMNLEQKERSAKIANSRRSPKKVVANLDLQEEIPIPKIVPGKPEPGGKRWWTPTEILDIRDSIMGSTRGYDLKVRWEHDEKGNPYEDSWEPSNNITKNSGYLFNRFKETGTFKDYILKRNKGKVEEPVPKKKKVRWTLEKDSKPPAKEHKIDESLAGKTRSGKVIGGIWRRDGAKAYTINLPRERPEETPEQFAKSKFGEFFGQVPSYLDDEQRERILAAFVQADLDELDEKESYVDHSDFNPFEDDDVSIERCIHQSLDTACYNYNLNEQNIDELKSSKGGKPRGNSPAAETSRVQGMRGGSPSSVSPGGGKPRGNSPVAETSRVQDMRGGSPSAQSTKPSVKIKDVTPDNQSKVNLDEDEIEKPPDFSNHPKRTPTNKEVNSFIEYSLEKIMEKIGIDEEAPKTEREMRKGKYEQEFCKAMDVEINSIMDHGTFEEVYCPEGVTPITCRWVYD